MKIAILGTGNVGSALGTGFTAAGHEVVYGARTPIRVAIPDRSVMSLENAAIASDVVVNALPGAVALSVLEGLGAAALDGKVLVDVANALTDGSSCSIPTPLWARGCRTRSRTCARDA